MNGTEGAKPKDAQDSQRNINVNQRVMNEGMSESADEPRFSQQRECPSPPMMSAKDRQEPASMEFNVVHRDRIENESN